MSENEKIPLSPLFLDQISLQPYPIIGDEPVRLLAAKKRCNRLILQVAQRVFDNTRVKNQLKEEHNQLAKKMDQLREEMDRVIQLEQHEQYGLHLERQLCDRMIRAHADRQAKKGKSND